MKKIIILAISLLLVSTGASFAGTQTATADGDAIAIPAGSAGGGAMDFNPSSSTTISVTTFATRFEIISGSQKNNTDDGMEYGVVSWDNAVYQRNLQTDNTITASTGTIVTANDTFVNKAGNTCPDS